MQQYLVDTIYDRVWQASERSHRLRKLAHKLRGYEQPQITFLTLYGRFQRSEKIDIVLARK